MLLQDNGLGRCIALEIGLMHWLDASHFAVLAVGLIAGYLHHCSGLTLRESLILTFVRYSLRTSRAALHADILVHWLLLPDQRR